jgi:hypothetical protein
MWRSRNNRDGTTVVCIACGTSLPRSETREYDKEGNRWDRHDKSFEHLCKECYRGLCHQPRDELEGLLIDVERAVDAERGAEGSAEPDCDRVDGDTDPNLPVESDGASGDGWRTDRPDGSGRVDDTDQSGDTDRTFLAEYFSAVEERYGPAEGPGHES